MRLRLALGLLLSFATACSSSDAPTSTSGAGGHAATTTATGGGGGAGGQGGGSTLNCSDETTLPDAKCGTLSWATSPLKSRKRNHHVTLAATTPAGPFLYVIGGGDGGGIVTKVDRAAIGADGSLGAFADQTPTLKAVAGAFGETIDNKVLVFGGGTMSTGKNVDLAWSAVVGADGTLGKWTVTSSLLKTRMHAASVSTGHTIYALGGFTHPDVWDDIVKADVADDGTVSTWVQAGTLPGPRSHMTATIADGYVFLTGGLDKSAFTNPPELKTVSRGHILADGTIGEWTDMPKLLTANATHGAFFYGGFLYVVGGITSNVDNRVWRAPIDATHTLGAWEEIASLPIKRGHVHQLPVVKNHVYSVAGAIDFNLNSTDEIDIGTFE